MADHRGKLIVDETLVMPWDQRDSTDLEIGLGIDWLNGRVAVLFNAHVRQVGFTIENAEALAAALLKQAAILRAGTPPGH